jgi:arylsulfatase A-like enzyme
MPTLLDLTGDTAAVPADTDGASIAPTLLGKPQAQKRHEFLYWEFRPGGGQQAVRAGDWKAVRQHMAQTPAGQTPKTELYDLATDPAESKDVAAEHPDVVARLEAVMTAQHVPSKLFPLPGIDEIKKPAKRNQPRAAARPAAGK